MARVELTGEQRDAVYAAGNVLVRAGAGSGKTEVLAQRFVALLAGDISRRAPLAPERIAAITFTEKATADMRRRIAEVLDHRIAREDDAARRARPPPPAVRRWFARGGRSVWRASRPSPLFARGSCASIRSRPASIPASTCSTNTRACPSWRAPAAS